MSLLDLKINMAKDGTSVVNSTKKPPGGNIDRGTKSGIQYGLQTLALIKVIYISYDMCLKVILILIRKQSID